jgi:selenocysteine lyase/cysteine desulfurase
MSELPATGRRAFLATMGAASAAGLLPPMAWDAIRERDSLAADGDFLFEPGLIYLQTGSLGPTPRPVMQRAMAAWQELERNPTHYGYGTHEQHLDAVRAQAATFLGADTDEIVLTTSTTDGLNRVAQALPLVAGDRVLTTDQEHPGGRACWQYLERTRGIIIDIVPIAPGENDGAAIAQRMEAAITPRTKVLSFSHVLSSTGLRMPVAELCASARRHGCLSVVDGAQAVGGIAVNVRALGCDVYATSGHKWLLAPPGTGLLYLRGGMRSPIDLMSRQGGAAAYSASTGVSNLPGIFGLGEALTYLGTRGMPAIESHNLSLRAHLLASLARVPQVTVVSPRDGALVSPLLSYRLPDAVQAGALRERLHRVHHLYVKVVPTEWFNGQRISTHLFNTPQHVDALITALRKELA